jgi:hypothetical protein
LYRSSILPWRQFEPEVILLAVGWYLRFSLSYRHVEELFAERGLRPDVLTAEVGPAPRPGRSGTTFASAIKQQPQLAVKTYIRVKGKGSICTGLWTPPIDILSAQAT